MRWLLPRALPIVLDAAQELLERTRRSRQRRQRSPPTPLNSPVMKSLSDQSVSGATMMTSIAGLPSMFATMAIARAASN